MKIGIDIDGVIRNWAGKLSEIYFRENPVHKQIRNDTYDVGCWFPIGKEIYKFGFEVHAEEIYTEAQVYPEAKEFLKKLHKDDELVFVTHQPNKNLEYLTIKWINKNELPHDCILFTKDKSKFKGDYLLDDYTKNLQRISMVRNSIPICFNQPWNQDWNGQRVNSYDKFLEIINK
ncbi:hypothetical protein HYS72_00970 [Candidatus Pacearchaeota archaeon]|nr:hypothetical protein [Candidatus Pacearchaeota archaeon]